jgi:hypothetical protein
VFWKSFPTLSSEWKFLHAVGATGSSKTLAPVCLTAVCYIQRVCNVNAHHHENLIFYISFFGGLFSEKC